MFPFSGLYSPQQMLELSPQHRCAARLLQTAGRDHSGAPQPTQPGPLVSWYFIHLTALHVRCNGVGGRPQIAPRSPKTPRAPKNLPGPYWTSKESKEIELFKKR